MRAKLAPGESRTATCATPTRLLATASGSTSGPGWERTPGPAFGLTTTTGRARSKYQEQTGQMLDSVDAHVPRVCHQQTAVLLGAESADERRDQGQRIDSQLHGAHPKAMTEKSHSNDHIGNAAVDGDLHGDSPGGALVSEVCRLPKCAPEARCTVGSADGAPSERPTVACDGPVIAGDLGIKAAAQRPARHVEDL